MPVVLGLNSFHAGASAALIADGKVLAAVAEERLNRHKYYAGFPSLAIKSVLKMGGLDIRDVEHVAIGRNPASNRTEKAKYFLSNPRLARNLLTIARKGNRRLGVAGMIAEATNSPASALKFKMHAVEHHVAHMASSYFISPWESCAGFTLDGSGDFVTTMFAKCEGSKIEPVHRVFVPNSLGSLYTMISEFIGYDSYGDEGKVMGLAPYGSDGLFDKVDDLVRLTPDGFRLNPAYFVPFGANQGIEIDDKGNLSVGRHYSNRMIEVFGEPRPHKQELSKRDMDLAAAVQHTFEKVYMHCLNLLHRKVPSDRLVMAGGCVLNSVANGKLFAETPFRQTCIQPAAGDDGLAVGAALFTAYTLQPSLPRHTGGHAYLGPQFSGAEIERALGERKLQFEKLSRDALLKSTVDELEQGKVIGWFQGRMEWGPRALGNRSILVHPNFPGMKDILNARIKRREWYRPFAPAVLAERQSEIFEHDHPSPYMLHVYKVRPAWRERLTAVTHADATGRLQSVAREDNAIYYDLIRAFGERTGIPVLLNTSFNENEPVVCTPAEAIDCFMRTKMDVLVLGDYMCRKSGQAAQEQPA